MNDARFFEYVALLLKDAGHMITSVPVYVNHSSSETLYIDSSKDVILSGIDRSLLGNIENVSLIMEMEWPGIIEELTEKVQIYSITVDLLKQSRSQDVADIHHLLQKFWTNNHSIVFFKNGDEFIISFADEDQSHILSDWYDLSEDYDNVVERISIENVSLDNSSDYFSDMLYSVAREYYLHPISFEDASYGMLPMDLLTPKCDSITNIVSDISVTKEDIKEIVRNNLSYYTTLYGDDYVGAQYEGMFDTTNYHDISAEIDRISFELDLAAEMDQESIDEIDFEFDNDDDYIDDDDDFYDDIDEDVDPAIFDDPVLMVKWLEKKQKQADDSNAHNKQLKNSEYSERKAREEAERIAREEAERKAREEAERKTREEAERKAREEAERKAREEAERIAREEAERKAREEAERIAREEAERKAREEAERKAREEKQRQKEEYSEFIYKSAINKISSNDISLLTRAIKQLESLKGWKDSSDIIRSLRNKISIITKQNEEHKKEIFRSQRLCQYCGGKFKGLIVKTCTVCGKIKDY